MSRRGDLPHPGVDAHDPFGLRARAAATERALAEQAESLVLAVDPIERAHASTAADGLTVARRVRLINRSDRPRTDLRVRVRLGASWSTSASGSEVAFVRQLDQLDPGETWIVENVRLRLDADRLRRIERREEAPLEVEVRLPDGHHKRWTGTLELLGWSEWPGLGHAPETTAAFVLPGDASLQPILDRARALTSERGGEGSEPLQFGDADALRAFLGDLWQALVERRLTAAASAPDFEHHGQAVRSPERLFGGGVGTSLDLSLAFAALLERAGLDALLLFHPGAVQVGLWLEPSEFDLAVVEDQRAVERRVEARLIAVVDPTGLTERPPHSLDEALAAGAARARSGDLLCAIDVRAARRRLVQPFLAGDFEPSLAGFGGARDGPGPDTAPVDQRLDAWKRRLLDLSLNNRFLSFRETRKTLELAPVPLAELEHALADGKVLRLVEGEAGDAPAAERRARLARDLQAGRLGALAAGDDLEQRLVEIRRAARHSLEESGANTLFGAFGFLEWRELDRPDRVLRAPLLLRPLVLDRGPNHRGWRLSAADDECRANEALVERLASEIGLDPAPFAELPQTDDGIDVEEWLLRWRRAIVDRTDWAVVETAVVGLFSFSKFLMWRDLDRHREALAASRVARFLIERPDEPFELEQPTFQAGPPSSTWVPLDADSSQLGAIEDAVAGRSFVLEGPPGTGKSQTITNLIARALSAGQRVLFVAEKRAALEVVQRRLEAIGIGPFCLELHSNKVAKRAVVEQLGRALEFRPDPVADDVERRGAELDALTAELDGHVDALHRERPIGRTLYAMLARSLELAGLPRVPLDLERPLDLNADDLEALTREAQALARAASLVEPGPDHPLDPVRLRELGPAQRRSVEEAARRLGDAAGAARRAWNQWLPGSGLASDAQATLPRVQGGVRALRTAVEAATPRAAALAESPDPEALAERARPVLEQARDLEARRSALLGRWDASLFEADLEQLQNELTGFRARGFFSRWFNRSNLAARFAPLKRGGELGDLGRAVDDLREARTLVALGAELERHELTERLGPDWFASLDSIDEVGRALDRALALSRAAAEFAGGDPSTDVLTEACRAVAGAEGAYRAALEALDTACEAYRAELDGAQPILALDLERFAGADGRRPVLEQSITLTHEIEALGPRLRDWCLWQAARASANATALAPLVAELDAAAIDPTVAVDALEASFTERWTEAAVEAEPHLRRFHGVEHDQRLERFRELDREWHQLLQRAIQARLGASVPKPGASTADGSELGILQRELRKKRGHLPVRRLLERLPTLVPRLAPCVLMSPLSAAQFLSAGLTRFDLVVFDEASQIPAWDGVGAMARGETVVVVGDSKQLPPTSFFQAVGDDDDADEDDLEELESLLDECVACGLPRRTLDWHYRSRDESLIAFSNAHYYGNRLETFPSPEVEDEKGLGWERVEGAVYDRSKSRTNPREAEALVARALAILEQQEDTPSLGIVTFSQAQQVLVETLLEKAARKDSALAAHLAADVPEPVFVKNLENVQGDERDVILLGVGYGPDAGGRFAMHFGPLNRRGGERRLNVAVTRARERLIVFSSFDPEEIDLRRTEALGVQHLRGFLEFAASKARRLSIEHGDDSPPRPRAERPDRLAERLAHLLEERGHRVERRVGASEFRIDLVVESAAGARVAVLLDGRGYARSRSARDRDRIRVQVLEGLGWQLDHVWSLDLWSDLEGCVAGIERALGADPGLETESAREDVEPPTPASEAPPAIDDASTVDDAEETESDPAHEAADAVDGDVNGPAAASGHVPARESSGPAPYLRARPKSRARRHERFKDAAETERVAECLLEVVDQEGPIEVELACRRVLDAYGFKRSTAKAVERVRETLEAVDADRRPTLREGFLWPTARRPETHAGFRGVAPDGSTPRQAEELPLEEVANAARWVLDQNLALDLVDLARETAKLFGFARLGSQLERRMRAGIEQLALSGRCRLDGERVVG
ncbi:MAG: DUF3320 domain-containing protein [Planctomycetota bacterium]